MPWKLRRENARRRCFALRRAPLIILILTLRAAVAVHAADPYSATLEKHFATGSHDANGAASAPEAGAPNSKVAQLEEGLSRQVQVMAQGPEVSPPAPVTGRNVLVVALGLSLGAL